MFLSKIDVKAFLQKAGKKNLMIAAGVAGCLAVGGLGTTLASNISLNNGATVEFGQGVLLTTACDHDVLVTPNSTFVNDIPGEFKFSSITISNLDSTDSVEGSTEGCQGKSFTIKMYKENGDLIARSYIISVGTGTFSSGDGEITSTDAGTSNSSVTLTFRNLDVAASDVYRITIQSSKLVGSLWAVRDGSHLYQINSINGGTNYDFGQLHDVSDTNNPTSGLGYDGNSWGPSGMAYNKVDGKMYVLIGKCRCGSAHSIYKFSLPSTGDTSSIIDATKVGVIDSVNNDGMDWADYGFRGIAINSQGEIYIAVHQDGNNQGAWIFQISSTDASILSQTNLNSDTADPDTGIYHYTDKHAYAMAFDSSDKLWFSARLNGEGNRQNIWKVSDLPQIWHGWVNTDVYEPNGNLTIDSNGTFWITTWNDYVWSFDPNTQSPGELSSTRRGRIPNNVYALAWTR